MGILDKKGAGLLSKVDRKSRGRIKRLNKKGKTIIGTMLVGFGFLALNILIDNLDNIVQVIT